jgi:hypothetical protein
LGEQHLYHLLDDWKQTAVMHADAAQQHFPQAQHLWQTTICASKAVDSLTIETLNGAFLVCDEKIQGSQIVCVLWMRVVEAGLRVGQRSNSFYEEKGGA